MVWRSATHTRDLRLTKMQWSKVKKRVEATFADCVRGRVEIWATRYRESHDGERVWMRLEGYLNTAFDEALDSSDPVLQGLAMLDRRLGKRRLREIDESSLHPMVAALYRFRVGAEGLHPNGDQRLIQPGP